MSIKKNEGKKPTLQKGKPTNQGSAGKAPQKDAKKNSSFNPKKK